MLKEKKLIANKIRAKIREKGLVQTEVAEKLSIAPSTFIFKLDEKYGSRFTVNQFLMLMEILDLHDINSLFEDVES